VKSNYWNIFEEDGLSSLQPLEEFFPTQMLKAPKIPK